MRISILSCALVVFFMSALTPIDLRAASLFGDHTCERWADVSEADQKTWVNAFIAPLSLTFKGLRKSSVDKYSDDPNAHVKAIASISDYCKEHPEQSAAHGAAAYLRQLIND